MAKLRITWIKSSIGYSKDQKLTLKALGFRRLNQSITHDDSASIRGMINKVRHLIKVAEEELNEAE
jgi:large subunit ribosomal protein L30